MNVIRTSFLRNSFNSIKVQLELYSSLTSSNNIRFNSIKVQLEHSYHFICEFENQCFNSIKVQLEQIYCFILFSQNSCFNSIKVQLEQEVTDSIRDKMLFQFHKGSIRTVSYTDNVVELLSFNSIKVQLEPSRYDRSEIEKLSKFQFHKGSIRTI